jgi:hypothetical protein
LANTHRSEYGLESLDDNARRIDLDEMRTVFGNNKPENAASSAERAVPSCVVAFSGFWVCTSAISVATPGGNKGRLATRAPIYCPPSAAMERFRVVR